MQRFSFEQQREMAWSLKKKNAPRLDDSEERAMTKERGAYYYQQTQRFRNGEIEPTPPERIEEIGVAIDRLFWDSYEYLPEEVKTDREAAEAFYRLRGPMVGIGTDWITPVLTAEGIIQAWWAQLRAKFLEACLNPVQSEFLDDAKAIESWSYLVFRLTAGRWTSIETAYRWAMDPAGNWRWIDDADPLAFWTYRDEPYLYQKWRDDAFGSIVAGNENVLILGAGSFPELRHTGYLRDHQGDLMRQRILMCDSDPSINLDFLLEGYPDWYKEHIEYRCMDLLSMLMELKANGRKFELIVVKGVFSFILDKLPQLMPLIMACLKPGGCCKFDLQLTHFAMVRDTAIFEWGGGRLELKSLPEAMAIINQTVADLVAFKICRVETELMYDDTYGEPFGVNVKFTTQ